MVLHAYFTVVFGTRLTTWDNRISGRCYRHKFFPDTQLPTITCEMLYIGGLTTLSSSLCSYFLGLFGLIALVPDNTSQLCMRLKKSIGVFDNRTIILIATSLSVLSLYSVITVKMMNSGSSGGGNLQGSWTGFGQIFALMMLVSNLFVFWKGVIGIMVSNSFTG